MNNQPNEFKDALRSLIERATHDHKATEEHLAPEDLLAYHTGELTVERANQAQEYLARCSSCAAMLLDLAGFTSSAESFVEPDPSSISDAEVAAAWSSLKPRLASLPTSKTPGLAAAKQFGVDEIAARRERRNQLFRSAFVPYAVAASLLLAVGALAFWTARLQRDNEHLIAQIKETDQRFDDLNRQLSQERAAREKAQTSIESAQQKLDDAQNELQKQRETIARRNAQLSEESRRINSHPTSSATPIERTQVAVNVVTAELYPREALRGGTEEFKRVDVPANARLISLTLNGANQKAYASYALDILDQNDKLVRTSAGLRKKRNNTFTLALPSRLFHTGQYRFKLYGIKDARRELSDEFDVIINAR